MTGHGIENNLSHLLSIHICQEISHSSHMPAPTPLVVNFAKNVKFGMDIY